MIRRHRGAVRRTRPYVVAATTLVVGLLVSLLSAPTPAGAARAEAVRVGAAPKVPAGAKVGAPLGPNAMLHVTVALTPRDPAALAQFAHDVSTPGTGVYHHYLTPGQFTALFGPTNGAVQAVRQALRSAGLDPGPLSDNHLALHVDATAAALSQAFSTNFRQYRLRSGRTAYANLSAPRIPATAAAYVQAVVGLDDLDQFVSQRASLSSAGSTGGAARPHVVTGGPQPCASAVVDAASGGVFTADQLASAYNFSSLYGTGDLGAGQTVALVEFERNLPSDIAAYQACYGTATPVSYVPVDGGATGSSRGSGEAALDIEDVLGLAPQVSILVYQAPNTASGNLDVLNAIVSQDAAKVVSTSWGLCEPMTTKATALAEASSFEEAAVQGQSFFAAAGDEGSEDCIPAQGSLAVDDPGSQPFVTDVGGTAVSALGPPPVETVWNDGPSASCCAGGGGVSSFWTMPSYQTGAPSSVGTVNSLSSGTPCSAGGGQYCREAPDVSADAGGNASGYIEFWGGQWIGVGGTSAAAPLWAALVALTDATPQCSGFTVGFADPVLYGVAASDPAAFHDITSGNNDVTGAEHGLYPATAHYDMASGLGSPNGARLPTDLCTSSAVTLNPVTVADPGSQSSYPGQAVGLQVVGSDATAGQTLTFGALGLPTGLSISPSGVIGGAASASGTSLVVVTAKDATGASDSVTFTWSVPSSVRQVHKDYGPGSGGTRVIIRGSGFAGTRRVDFGSAPARAFTVNGAGTRITATTPSGTGMVFVTVTGPSGTSAQSPAAQFDYGPTLSRITPGTGPTTGGTKVVITGTNFTGVTAVRFGGNAASSVTVNAAGTRITAMTPAGAPGTVNVVVTTVGGSSPASSSAEFVYT